MRIMSVITVVMMFLCGCLGSPPDLTTATQALCTEEDQQAWLCDDPGGGWLNLRQYTHDAQQAQAPGQTPINESWGYCNSSYCAVRWEFASYVIVTACTVQNNQVVHCTTISCTPGSGDCSST